MVFTESSDTSSKSNPETSLLSKVNVLYLLKPNLTYYLYITKKFYQNIIL